MAILNMVIFLHLMFGWGEGSHTLARSSKRTETARRSGQTGP
jgi:hypothetical protein